MHLIACRADTRYIIKNGGAFLKKENIGKLRIIPLGGLEQIGMNITAFEYEDSIIVVDCGLAFPEDDMLGIDLVIPDVSYLKDHIEKVKGFVITHGHEDHIGALPYILKEMNLPIYTTKLTMGIIENKLKEHNLLRATRRRVVHHGQSINLGQFRIEFIKTNHSIQDASALALYSPAGIVVHTGDFKVDYTPVFGDHPGTGGHAGGNQWERHASALRRDRQPGRGVYDREAGCCAGGDLFPRAPLYQRARQGKGGGSGKAGGPVCRAHPAACGEFYRYPVIYL